VGRIVNQKSRLAKIAEQFKRTELFKPQMEYYQWVYKNSMHMRKNWSLADKHVIVYMEQGFGDIIQFLRYIPLLKEKGCKVTLHCPQHLHRLIDEQGWGVFLLDKEKPELPEHDYHILSLNLPSIVKNKLIGTYLQVKPRQDLEGNFKIGICWESGPGKVHDKKSCPLKYFERISGLGNLYSLQKDIYDSSLTEGAEQLELYGVDGINDFADTASYIAALDLVVSVDTATLHLAGALGVKTIGIMGLEPDSRWAAFNWYPSIGFIDGPFDEALDQVYEIHNS